MKRRKKRKAAPPPPVGVTCVLYESVEAADAAGGGPGLAPVGAMWFAPWYLQGGGGYLAPEYFTNNAIRWPVVVVLPDRTNFCVDSRTVSDGKLGDHGWTVTGEPPQLTVTPSIQIGGGWHGYLTAGVLVTV